MNEAQKKFEGMCGSCRIDQEKLCSGQKKRGSKTNSDAGIRSISIVTKRHVDLSIITTI